MPVLLTAPVRLKSIVCLAFSFAVMHAAPNTEFIFIKGAVCTVSRVDRR